MLLVLHVIKFAVKRVPLDFTSYSQIHENKVYGITENLIISNGTELFCRKHIK